MRKPNKWNLEKAIQLKEKKGYSYAEIADYMGVKPITIQSYFLRNFGKLKYNGAKEVVLTQRQKEIMFGGLLGDSNLHINLKGINAWGKIEHSLKQEDYLKHKREIFKNITSTVKYSDRFDKRTNKIYYSCRFNFKTNPALNEFYDMFYNDKKDVPKGLSLLTPEAIAIWYMDDGTKNLNGYTLCTNSFSIKGNYRLISKLLDYNIEATLQSFKNVIYIKKRSKETFKNLIEPYIIDSMKYKI